MNLSFFVDSFNNTERMVEIISSYSWIPLGAIAGNVNTASNMNMVIIGLVVVVLVLIVITLFGDHR